MGIVDHSCPVPKDPGSSPPRSAPYGFLPIPEKTSSMGDHFWVLIDNVHSFHTLVADLSTVALNDVTLGGPGSFAVVAAPTPGQ